MEANLSSLRRTFLHLYTRTLHSWISIVYVLTHLAHAHGTCGIWVVFPLPVSPTTTQLIFDLISLIRAPLAGYMGSNLRWCTISMICDASTFLATLSWYRSAPDLLSQQYRKQLLYACVHIRARKQTLVLRRSCRCSHTTKGFFNKVAARI